MSKQMAIRLDDELYKRLSAVAKKTGRTATFYVREAIEEHLEDLEDRYLAEDALNKLNSGKDTVMTSDAFWNDLAN